jgi:SAM-dependent methyltransferase
MATKALISGIFRNKTVYRTMLESLIADQATSLSGLNVLDLAGTRRSGYHRFLSDAKVTTCDLRAGEGVDVTADASAGLPFADASFDAVLLMNALYAFEDPAQVLAEARRVLAPGGRLLLGSPFVAQEMPEPHDFVRFTDEGLTRLLGRVGFSVVRIDRIGDRFSSAVYAVNPLVITPVLKAIVYPVAWLCDAVWRATHPRYRFPLGYLVEARPVDSHA